MRSPDQGVPRTCYRTRFVQLFASGAPPLEFCIVSSLAVLRCFESTAQQTILNIAINSSNISSESRHDNDEVQSLSSVSLVAPTLRSWLPRRLRLRLSSAPNPAVLSPALLPATSRGMVAFSASVELAHHLDRQLLPLSAERQSASFTRALAMLSGGRHCPPPTDSVL